MVADTAEACFALARRCCFHSEMDVASFIVSVVSGFVALAALWYARSSATASGRSATAAERSAGAAEGSERSAGRSADAAEEALAFQREGERRAAEAEERSRVVWSFDHFQRSAYVLRNAGTHTAYSVRVDVGEMLARGTTNFESFDAGHVEKYILSRSLGISTEMISITWHQDPDCQDEPRTERFPVL